MLNPPFCPFLQTSERLPAISWLDEALLSECSLDRTSEAQVGDVVSGVRIGNEMFRYLAVGDHDASAAGVMVALKGAEGDVWLQLERPLSEVRGVVCRPTVRAQVCFGRYRLGEVRNVRRRDAFSEPNDEVKGSTKGEGFRLFVVPHNSVASKAHSCLHRNGKATTVMYILVKTWRPSASTSCSLAVNTSNLYLAFHA